VAAAADAAAAAAVAFAAAVAAIPGKKLRRRFERQRSPPRMPFGSSVGACCRCSLGTCYLAD